MREFKILCILLFLSYGTKAKPDFVRSCHVDTLGMFGDSALVQITYFENYAVTENCHAFLLPDCIRLPRYAFFGLRFLKRKVFAPLIIPHGETITYRNGRIMYIVNYEHGTLQSCRYFDKKEIEISKEEFNLLEKINFDCSTTKGFSHLILGEALKKCDK